jgi:transposase InsO family protein
MSQLRRKFTREFKVAARRPVCLRRLHTTAEGPWRGYQLSRKSNLCDNAKAESFIKTLKPEEVNRVEYRDLAKARRGIRHFLERTYNSKRLHSAHGYRPPSEIDALPQNRKVPA